MNRPVLANHSLHVRFAILLPAMNVEDVKNEVLKEEDMVKSEEGSQEDLGLKTVQPGPSPPKWMISVWSFAMGS